MAEFKKQTLKINGVDTVVLSAGEGEPLLFLHGGGTWHGYEFAKKWAEKFHVIHPHHPGFGESGDDPAMDTFNDYVMHYVELLDALGIDKVHLVGFSLGGYLAAQIASQHPRAREDADAGRPCRHAQQGISDARRAGDTRRPDRRHARLELRGAETVASGRT